MQGLQSLSLAVDAGLAVLIWLVQLIVYPSFHHIAGSDFPSFHSRYTRLMGYIVAPLMIAQIFLHLALAIRFPQPLPLTTATLAAATWLSTFALSVPCHRELQAEGYQPAVVSRLVSTNWIRTALWTAIALLALLDQSVLAP